MLDTIHTSNKMQESISRVFPDKEYVPFSKGRLILENLVLFDMEAMRKLTSSDCWGIYILNESSGKIKPLYNAYMNNFDVQQKFRNTIKNDFNIVTKQVNLYEKLVILMWGANGWSVHAKRMAFDKWEFSFFHHPEYLKNSISNLKLKYMMNGSRSGKEYSINSSKIVSIKGEIQTVTWSPLPQFALLVTMSDNSLWNIWMIPLVEEFAEGLYRTVINHYTAAFEHGQPIWKRNDQEDDIHGDENLFHSVRMFLDKCSYHVTVN